MKRQEILKQSKLFETLLRKSQRDIIIFFLYGPLFVFGSDYFVVILIFFFGLQSLLILRLFCLTKAKFILTLKSSQLSFDTFVLMFQIIELLSNYVVIFSIPKQHRVLYLLVLDGFIQSGDILFKHLNFLHEFFLLPRPVRFSALKYLDILLHLVHQRRILFFQLLALVHELFSCFSLSPALFL